MIADYVLQVLQTNPILESRTTVLLLLLLCYCVTLMGRPLDSETGLTAKLWANNKAFFLVPEKRKKEKAV